MKAFKDTIIDISEIIESQTLTPINSREKFLVNLISLINKKVKKVLK